MRVPVLLACLLLACLLLTSASAAEPALPAEAVRILDKHDQALVDAQKACDAAIAKADEAAAKELDKVLSETMKKGDLEASTAIDARIKALRAKADSKGKALLIPANKPTKASDNAMLGTAPGYPGMVGCSGLNGWFDFGFALDRGGDYYLFALMTAEESRPCGLAIDDHRVGKVFSETTGSWQAEGLAWFRYGPYKLGSGAHLMHITPEGLSPHFKGFALTTAEKIELPKDAFGK